MTIPATTSSALVAFPTFSDLPTELRLQIIEETLDSVSSDARPYPFLPKRCLSPYACIDQEWNRAVELRLFKNIQLCSGSDGRIWTTSFIRKELDNFGVICGKRLGRLSRAILNIRYVIYPDFTSNPHLQILFQLFDVMRDWDPRDREHQGLIEVALDYVYLRDSSIMPRPHLSTDLGKFPKVPIIGSFHEPEPQYGIVRLHPGLIASLCQKLPHARHASLTLPSGLCRYVSRQNFIGECAPKQKTRGSYPLASTMGTFMLTLIDALDSLRAHKPGLTHLDLKAACASFWRLKALQSTLLPIMERLSASPSPWSDRLEILEVHHNITVPDFLRAASKVPWPKLKIIKLSGAIDVRHNNSGKTVDRAAGPMQTPSQAQPVRASSRRSLRRCPACQKPTGPIS